METVFDGDGFNGDPIYAPLDVVFDVTKRHNRGTRLFVQTQYHGEAYTLALSDQLQTMFEARQRDVERTREIGVMRAVGARSRTIMGMLVMEGVLQGLLSWVVPCPSLL